MYIYIYIYIHIIIYIYIYNMYTCISIVILKKIEVRKIPGRIFVILWTSSFFGWVGDQIPMFVGEAPVASWEIPDQNGAKWWENHRTKRWIFHCHVWLQEGKLAFKCKVLNGYSMQICFLNLVFKNKWTKFGTISSWSQAKRYHILKSLQCW